MRLASPELVSLAKRMPHFVLRTSVALALLFMLKTIIVRSRAQDRDPSGPFGGAARRRGRLGPGPGQRRGDRAAGGRPDPAHPGSGRLAEQDPAGRMPGPGRSPQLPAGPGDPVGRRGRPGGRSPRRLETAARRPRRAEPAGLAATAILRNEAPALRIGPTTPRGRPSAWCTASTRRPAGTST